MGHNAPVCEFGDGQVGAVENQVSRGRCRQGSGCFGKDGIGEMSQENAVCVIVGSQIYMAVCEDVRCVEHAVVFTMEGVMAMVTSAGGAVAAVMVMVAVLVVLAGHAEAYDVAVVVVRHDGVHHRQQEGHGDQQA